MDVEELTKKLDGKRCTVWDFDGTIVRMRVDWLGLKQELQEIGSMPKNQEQSINSVFKSLISLNKKREAMRCISQYESVATYEPVTPTLKFIRSRSSEYLMHIFSDNLHATIEKILDQESVLVNFNHIIGKDDVGEWKPHPEGLLTIMNKESCTRKEMIFVGDSWKDKRAAQNFGIDFIQVKNEN